MDGKPALSASMSIGMKVNIGNYQSAEVFISVSGVTAETREAEVIALLDGPAETVYGLLKARLTSLVKEIHARVREANATKATK